MLRTTGGITVRIFSPCQSPFQSFSGQVPCRAKTAMGGWKAGVLWNSGTLQKSLCFQTAFGHLLCQRMDFLLQEAISWRGVCYQISWQIHPQNCHKQLPHKGYDGFRGYVYCERLQKPWAMEGNRTFRGGIHQEISDACSSQALCADPALRSAFFPE